jgi:signal transduction histidine kinase
MRIADELSDLARLTGEHAALQNAPFRLVEVLQSGADRMLPALRGQDMTVEILVDPPGPLPLARGDAQRLAQGFGTLVGDLARHSNAAP